MITELTALIEEWARARNLDTAEPTKQVIKLGEEFGELCQGMVKSNREQVEDSLGDVYVVLVILAMQMDMNIEKCVAAAYEEIKDRRGKMVNGVYIKESDL